MPHKKPDVDWDDIHALVKAGHGPARRHPDGTPPSPSRTTITNKKPSASNSISVKFPVGASQFQIVTNLGYSSPHPQRFGSQRTHVSHSHSPADAPEDTSTVD